MAEELQGKGMGIGADVILEFTKSISNIQAFGEQLELLDARFGSLDQRIDTMRNSLSALSSQTSKSSGNNLRKSIENELNNLIAANGAVFSSIGNAPLKVKRETVQHLFARIDAELNRAILKQIANINVKIDPNYNTGTIPIGKDEFDELNKEIARLVKTQVRNLVDSVRKNGGKILSDDSLSGLELDISKSTVKQILLSVKEQLKPVLVNPKVDVEGQSLTITQKDLAQMMSKVKDKVKDALHFDVDGVLNKGNNVDDEIIKSARKIDAIVENYAKEVRKGIEKIDPRTVEVPMQTLSKRLQKHIADQMGSSPEELTRTLKSIDVGSAHAYELQRQFSGLERTINSKLSSGTSRLMTDLKNSVRSVELQPSGELKHYLINEINKLNNEIVRKIRESVDNQFRHMRAEVETVSSEPRDINRNGRIRSMTTGGGSGRNIIYNTYNTTNNNSQNRDTPQYSDPYARRDNYFNGFGLEGAVINTIRHIIAGSLVGAPMMAMYKAVETFQTSQEEQLKIMQNMSLKDEYKDSKGNTNWGKVDTDGKDLMDKVKQMSNFYALDLGQMSQVAAIASRLTNDKKEAQQFTDQAAKIYRLDNESDLVGTIAPGLEAIMAQFKLSVWDLDKVVSAFAVATNKTKATSDEVMKAMTRSGAALNASGVRADQAVALNAIAIQRSGQSGEVIGNMFKTLAARVTLPQVVDKLKGYGIDVYETNDMGIKQRRNLIDILSDTAKVAKSSRTGEDEISQIMLGEGGGYHYSKIMSFLDDMSKSGTTDLNYYSMMQEIKSFQNDPEKLASMLAKTMGSPTVTMERAGVSVNNALYSILEEMNPQIQQLSRNITNLAQGLEDNADTVSQAVNTFADALVGFGAMYGLKKVGSWGNYDQRYENAVKEKGYFGGRSLSGRQVYGATDFLNEHVIGDSREVRNKMNDRSFYRAAMKNDALRGYMEELSNLDNDRRREIRQYIQDHTGKVDNMADLFSILDESRGYRRPKREELTVDEVHRRAEYNVRSMVNNKEISNVFTREFADSLVNTLSNRGHFENMDDNHKNTAKRIAEMDDVKRKDFHSFLDQNYNSIGKTINDIEGLNKAIDEYEQRSRQSFNSSRRSSEAYRDLSRAIRTVSSEIDRTSKSRMDGFLDFLDRIPQKARGAGGAIVGIAKNIGSFAKQLGIAIAVGDTLSSVAENSLLTNTQRDIRDFKNSHQEAAKGYVSWEENGGGKAWYKPSQMATGALNLLKGVQDWFLPGNQKVDQEDINSFRKGFEKWLDDKYGTNDWKKALSKANKGRDKNEKYSLEDLTNMYLDDSGSNYKLQKKEEKDFIEQYKKFSISEAEQQERQRKAEEARKAWENKMYDEGQLQYFSVENMKQRVEEKQNEAQKAGSLKLVNALLQGVKSDSEEYMKLRLAVIKQERQAYKNEINEIDRFIQERREAVQYLEETDRRYVKDKHGHYKRDKDGDKIETSEYKKQKEYLKDAEAKREEIKKEFELSDREKALEAQRIQTEYYINDANKSFSRAQARKQYTDTLNQLTMNTESPQYIDSQIASTRTMIAEMTQKLGELQSRSIADPDGELQDTIQNLKQQIASAEVEVKNLRLQRLTAWRTPFTNSLDDVEIKYLQKRVSLGPSVDDDSILARDLRIQELQERKSVIDRALAQRRADLTTAKNDQEFQQIMKDIRDLTKQSLQAQLSMNQELKAQLGGTFNLPDGVRAMSQYDYMASKGSHSNFTIQSGDMYVNITLPNVTDKTGSQQLTAIGVQLGQALAQGKADALRSQLNSGPYGYRPL